VNQFKNELIAFFTPIHEVLFRSLQKHFPIKINTGHDLTCKELFYYMRLLYGEVCKQEKVSILSQNISASWVEK